MKKLSQTLCILLLGLTLSGQTVWIDSVYSTPTPLSTENEVLVIASIVTPSSGCNLIDAEVDLDENTKEIEIMACYSIGLLQTPCGSIDTFLIGQLAEGEYTIKLRARGPASNGNCANVTNETVEEIEILVNGTNSIIRSNKPLFKFELFKNPVSDYATFNIESDEIKMNIVIVNHLGRIEIKKQLEGDYSIEKSINIEIAKLPIGIYYCYLENENGKSNVVKMMKN